jgi:hypothetical protein
VAAPRRGLPPTPKNQKNPMPVISIICYFAYPLS